jgi:gas vesicle protein
MYREEQPGASFMLGIMTGALIGAGVALLFAPKAGTEMRQQLGEQYRGLADRVGESTQHLRESARQLRDQGRERVQQLTEHLSDRAATAADRAATAAERFPSSAPSV